MIIEQESIVTNDKISEEKLAFLIEKSEIKDAENTALRFLSYSPHSEARLRIKLIKKKFSNKSIDRVIKNLKQYSYLNDAEYARAWLISRIKKRPESKSFLFYGLLKQGIQRNTAKEIIEKHVTYETELECAERVITKLLRYNDLSEKKLEKKLYSRGFKVNVINEVLKDQ